MTTQVILDLFLRCGRVSTDTRKVQSGDLFVALRGERFDANQFAAQALEAGAAAVIVDNQAVVVAGDERYVLVEDSLRALQDLGRAYRRTFDIPFLGITGSNGKTTTKELVQAVLQTEKRAFATRGNFNNHIGVPLTLLSIPRDTEIAIIEMGANQPGDIKELAEIAEPTHGLITNIGQAHLERFGSLDGVRRTKGELFDFLRAHGGTIFVNLADERVVQAAQPQEGDITFGTATADYAVELQSQGLEGMELVVRGSAMQTALSLHSQLTGAYNAMNVLVATMIGQYFGLSHESIARGVYQYVPANNRSQLIRYEGKTIMLDAYNANPSSMRAAIANAFAYGKPKVLLVLGDMLEMGSEEREIHAEMGRFINGFSPWLTVGVGARMQAMVEALEGPGRWFPTTEATKTAFGDLLAQADMILIKGSRGMALEQLMADIPDSL